MNKFTKIDFPLRSKSVEKEKNPHSKWKCASIYARRVQLDGPFDSCKCNPPVLCSPSLRTKKYRLNF